jgi:fatty-acyl-CoA synthase
MADLNIDVTHLYGLTETFGPAAICEWAPEWDALDATAQARLKARQGVANVVSRPLRVVDETGRDVPADATTMGQVALRGNNVMAGYHRDPDATAAAAPDGWFLTGDLGVMHPDGYVELRDRAKDVIISGGENVSTIEIEQAIATHPAVLEVAVVSMPDDQWGEVPAAFVATAEGTDVSAAEIVDHVRARLARFKSPKHVVFGPLPKTSTGKIQKYVLREQLWSGHDRRIH